MCSSRAVAADQLEIVSLLRKLHAIQVDNSDRQSALIRHQLDVRRRDLVVDWQHRHGLVAKGIIGRQRILLHDAGVHRPPDLQRMHDAFAKEELEIADFRRCKLLPAVTNNKV